MKKNRWMRSEGRGLVTLVHLCSYSLAADGNCLLHVCAVETTPNSWQETKPVVTFLSEILHNSDNYGAIKIQKLPQCFRL